jgi:hypothetical protein
MSGGMLLLLFFLAFGAAGVWYTSQVKKNYLGELEEYLTLQNFSMKGLGGYVILRGEWRDKKISIELQPFMFNRKPAYMLVSIANPHGFNMVVRPGELITKQKQVAAGEEETFRPWRNPRLTDEEKQFIAQRSGTVAPEAPAVKPADPQRFLVNSDNPSQAGSFLAKEERAKLIESLFVNSNFEFLRIDSQGITGAKCPYSIRGDLDKTAVKKYLDALSKIMD